MALSWRPRWSGSKMTAGMTRHRSTALTKPASGPGVPPPGFITAMPIMRWPMLYPRVPTSRICSMAKTAKVAQESPPKAKLLISSAMPQSMQRAKIRRPARAMDPGPDSGRPSRSPGYLEKPEVSGPVSQEPMSLRSTTVQVYRSAQRSARPHCGWDSTTLWTDDSLVIAGHPVTCPKQCGHGREMPDP